MNNLTIRGERAGDRTDGLCRIPLSVEIIGRRRDAGGGSSRRRLGDPGRVVPARTGRVLFRPRCFALVRRERRGLFRLLIVCETDARHPISFDRPRREVAALVCRALRASRITRCWSTLRRWVAQERCHVRVGRKIQTEKISRNENFRLVVPRSEATTSDLVINHPRRVAAIVRLINLEVREEAGLFTL